MSDPKHSHSQAYQQAGVDIDKGNAFVEGIKPYIHKTKRPEVLSSLGHFAGLFQLDLKKYQTPILVSATDGVGTKLKIAQALGRYDTIGIDLVAMNVNDLICLGAEPLFFLDYYASGALDVDVATEVIKGIATACQETHCSLIGGETAEMPSVYANQDFDLAGFVVGVVEKGHMCEGTQVQPGHHILGLPSSGFHSNGYSLVRKIVADNQWDLAQTLPGTDQPLGELLLEPTTLYVKPVLDIYAHHQVDGMAHITGGGLLENIPRILPDHCRASLQKDSWRLPPVMKIFQDQGKLTQEESFRVFNCGIGFVLIVPPHDSAAILKKLQKTYPEAAQIGTILPRQAKESAIKIL
jgi:phosphoribosylformylglycinamidine cyclo-ligase